MTKQLLILFIVFNILNVIIQTIKSIATIKCGKAVAAIINAVAYGLYTYIVVLTMCDLPLLWKCFIVAGCNFVGVFTVKWFEEKARKDKLWKVELTIPNDGINPEYDDCIIALRNAKISMKEKRVVEIFAYCVSCECKWRSLMYM